MRLRLQKLQEAGSEAQELRQPKAQGYKEIDEIYHYWGLPFVTKAIWTDLISSHHNNPLAGHFGIKKTYKFLTPKYYWPTFYHDVKVSVKDCDVCLSSKAVCHKPYSDLQLLPVLTDRWNNILMDFMIGLPVSINLKKNSYDSILIIVNWLTKIVYHKPVKITLDAPVLAKVIIDVVIHHHRLPDSIVTNRGPLFTSNFWSLLCYFFGIKRRLFAAFHLQTDS